MRFALTAAARHDACPNATHKRRLRPGIGVSRRTAAGYMWCTASDYRPLADRLPGLDNTEVIEVFPCPP